MVRQQVRIFEILTILKKPMIVVGHHTIGLIHKCTEVNLLFKLGNTAFVEIKAFLLSDNWSWRSYFLMINFNVSPVVKEERKWTFSESREQKGICSQPLLVS